MWSSIPIGVIVVTFVAAYGHRECSPSVTTVSGLYAPRKVCSGQLVFSEEFDQLDIKKWQHEITLAGGGNWEFQYYNNNRTNSFAEDGVLFIQPTLTVDHYGQDFLETGLLNVESGVPAERCTNPMWYGCERQGTNWRILNPIKSARIRTVDSFNFRYGRVEVRAKMPAGDWLWPAIWLFPRHNFYGTWPASGEINIAEARGNRDLKNGSMNIGTQQMNVAVGYGPYDGFYAMSLQTEHKNNEEGFDKEFHLYQLDWTPDYIKLCIDDEEVMNVNPGEGGFWEYGGYKDSNHTANPWRDGEKMAPFDQKFYFIINVAVGGINGFFPDNAENPTNKTWLNDSPTAYTDFWEGRDNWLPTWNLDKNYGRDAALQVDYVRVWAL